MTLPEITPVLLCGGSGTRLWPLSRRSYPKQFSRLIGRESLFQASARRLSGSGFGAPIVLTANDFRFLVAEQLAAVEIAPSRLLIEPDARNTGPAILAAALSLAATGPGALMIAAPSDHVIADTEAFRATVRAAIPRAQQGDLVTFGIVPTRPETGYGYLELAAGTAAASNQPQALQRFVEKPDLVRATAMLAAGNFLWNAGIFLFTADTLIRAFRRHAPEILAGVEASIAAAAVDLPFTRLDAKAWRDLPDVSIDYAIMEKADNLAVMPFGAPWSDLGGWDAVWSHSLPDDKGNACIGQTTAIACTDTLLRSESDRVELVGIGLTDIIAVAMPDAVLVAHRHHAQEVRKAVAALKSKGATQAEAFPASHRPWGIFECLVAGPHFQVKRIVVKPGKALSLQSHHHRAEHWIVVEGTARVTIDGASRLVAENQSVYIPLGAVHRLENPGKIPLTLIEVQTGSYLGEDDIIRYEDRYARD